MIPPRIPPDLFTTALEVESAFYDALDRADVDALMALWSDDEEVVCVHPGGPRLLGVEAVRAAWSEVLSNGGLHIRVVQRTVLANLSCAVHHVIEQIQVEDGGKVQTVNVAATNVYFKTPSGWRLVAHHASPAGQDVEPHLPQANLRSLH
jgi:ketosteroid isomerase-like protein